MLIDEKYFNQDKNYLLKTVQAFSKEVLIDSWIESLFKSYSLLHNPMGLVDDFILELKERIHLAKPLLKENYDILAAIYRLNYGDNQLEFQWDGRTHMEKYDEEWKSKFNNWIDILSSKKGIQRPIIKYAVLDQDINTEFLKIGIRKEITRHFKVGLRSNSLYRLSA